MPDLSISSAAALTGANLASNDLFPTLDVSAASGSKGSSMTPAEKFAGLLRIGNTSLGTNVTSGTINLGSITDTTSRPLSITQTWNNAGLTATGLKFAAVITAANTASRLFDICGGAAGTTSLFSVRSSGLVVIGNTAASGTITDGAGAGVYFGRLDVTSPSAFIGYFSNGYTVSVKSDGVLGFGSTGEIRTCDAFFMRAGTASIQLGANHATATTNQTLKAHDVTTGTGADLILSGGSGSVANGNVRFGTHSAVGAETVTGFITIKDAGGTVRKLAVIS